MTAKGRFRCPACDFPIFNRRVANCESCSAPLPADLLFTRKQVEVIDAERARIEGARVKLRQSTGAEGSADGVSAGGFGGFDFDVDGGGCD